ncbi:MAG TPA: hypothetical protein VK302_09220 [Terriglobales bacterium]|nr:hypothetical protein [Terriglobales bacterium]
MLAVTVFVPLSSAQIRGAMGRPVFVGHAGLARGVRGGVGLHHERRPFTRGMFLGSPFFYSNYDGSAPYVVEGDVGSDVESAPPQFVVVQPVSADDSPRKTRLTPLLIEWQGDRYVRFGGTEETAERGTSTHPDYAEPTIAKTPAKPAMSATQKERSESPAGELPLAVLVYRDGHREEIPDYAIADGVIYVRGNNWQNGYWTKRIPLSALDAPATMQANQQRGVKFMLPSAPNVVIASF